MLYTEVILNNNERIMRKIIPIVRLETLVPAGDYCYTPMPAPSPDSGFRMKVKPCPFWSKPAAMVAAYGEQMSGYCSYLRQGDWMPDGTFMLWDQVKECGVNYDDREFEELAVRPWDESSNSEAVPLPVKLAGGASSFEVPLT